MTTGFYLTADGMVMVDYGARKLPISPAQYRANGYMPSFEKLMDKTPVTTARRSVLNSPRAANVGASRTNRQTEYHTAVRQKAVRIVAAGMTNEVAFEPVDGPINDRVGDGDRAKYRLSPMISARARCATVGNAAYKTFLSRHEFIMQTCSRSKENL